MLVAYVVPAPVSNLSALIVLNLASLISAFCLSCRRIKRCAKVMVLSRSRFCLWSSRSVEMRTKDSFRTTAIWATSGAMSEEGGAEREIS